MGFEGRIYLVTNLLNGKGYVGQTTGSVIERWRDHLYEAKVGHGSVLHKAIRSVTREHGEASIEIYFKIIELPPLCINQADLDNLEIHSIAEFKTKAKGGWGYNVKDGGSYGRHSVETRAKISAVKLGYKDSLETRANKTRAMLERWSSPEFRERELVTIKNRLNGPESVARRRATLRRVLSTPEVKLRRGQIMIERWADPENKERIQTNMRAAASRPEVKLRRTQIMTERWKDPEYREHMLTKLHVRMNARQPARQSLTR